LKKVIVSFGNPSKLLILSSFDDLMGRTPNGRRPVQRPGTSSFGKLLPLTRY
jgi:hypothetical protein